MAKRKIILLFYIVLITVSCNGQREHELMGSTWVKSGELCFDSLHFEDRNKYREYYCDTKNDVKGTYAFHGDTLVLTAFHDPAEVLDRYPNAKINAKGSKCIPTYITKYRFSPEGVIEKVYFKDIITGYESVGVETFWKYSRTE